MELLYDCPEVAPVGFSEVPPTKHICAQGWANFYRDFPDCLLGAPN